MMKKFPLIFCAMLLSLCLAKQTFAQQSPSSPRPKPFSVNVSVGRAATITDWRTARSEFNFTATLNYRISKRFTANASVVKTMTTAPVLFRLGISYRLFSF